MLDIMMLDTLNVKSVILNVLLVVLIQVVLLVPKEEMVLQNVHVQKVNILTKIGSVNLVTTCVKPVTLTHIPVIFVLVTESMLLTVLVL
jgi:hypothetical protein